MAPVLTLDAPSRFYGKLLGAPADVLVLGAGDGVVATSLVARGHRVVAVEASDLLRGLIIERRAQLAEPERLTLVRDDPRTLRLGRLFALVLAPHQALGLARSPDELHALLTVVAHHLAPEGVFALHALNEPVDSARPRPVPHLRERSAAVHPLSPLRLSAQALDEALDDVGLQPRERFADFSETPFSPDAPFQVIVGGRA